MTLSVDSMYQQIILDHYKHPQHRGLPEAFDAEVHHVNPTCGDEVTLRVRVAGGTIADLGWEGEGCSISQASTSVMSGLVVGKPVDEALALQQSFLELMQSRGTAELTEADVSAALHRFRSVPLDQRRRIVGLEPKRADVIIGGVLLLSRLLAHFHADRFVVSVRGLRYGLLSEAARRPE